MKNKYAIININNYGKRVLILKISYTQELAQVVFSLLYSYGLTRSIECANLFSNLDPITSRKINLFKISLAEKGIKVYDLTKVELPQLHKLS